MTGKGQLKGKLGHVVKMRVCLLTRLPWLITFKWQRSCILKFSLYNFIHTVWLLLVSVTKLFSRLIRFDCVRQELSQIHMQLLFFLVSL